MNVIHIFPYSARQPGGVNNAICAFIACQRAAGINAVGISEKDERLPQNDLGFPVAEVSSFAQLAFENLSTPFGIGTRDTLINFHSVSYNSRALTQGLRRARVPYVLSEHGHLSFQNAGRWLKKFVYLNCVDRETRKAAGLQVLSRMAYDRLTYLLPAYKGSVLVQGNLVTVPPKAQMPPPSERSIYGIPSDAFVILYLGRIDVYTKGLDIGLKAFSRLPPDRFRLVLAGPDWQGGLAELQQLCRQLGCDSRVHFIGAVYGDKKWATLRMADLFVLPSRKDAFPLSVIEAMASGLPVLTSNRINLAEEFEGVGAALTVRLSPEALAEAILKFQTGAQFRERLICRGGTWAEAACDHAKAGARFGDFYQSIFDKRPKHVLSELPGGMDTKSA